MTLFKKKFVRTPIEEESLLSYEELTGKLNKIIEKQKELKLHKLEGAPLFLWKKEGESEYSMKYYHSYKKDMCDTMLAIRVEKGLERSGVYGYICKPAGIWGVFWGIIATLLLDFLILSYCLLFVAGFDLTNGLMVSAAAIIVRAYICLSLLELTKDRMSRIKGELLRILHEKEEKDEQEEQDESEEQKSEELRENEGN